MEHKCEEAIEYNIWYNVDRWIVSHKEEEELYLWKVNYCPFCGKKLELRGNNQ